ncbi:hypothetical protein LO772_28945 [Yinghuangia sp. ASG 101]|uniref:hypothetical protein n=1 Tax=Yinghuangia sp. ASG 101 TaxID=2896848 RepID=UPI001E646AC7|nr:hypothetical protein [Yinghuangia sp. ASG 101]UGQ10805.1 hypothetical protein LO772_28945 [Yinghuangia sp. ASG 101]
MRRGFLWGATALVLMTAAVGCSSSDDTADAASTGRGAASSSAGAEPGASGDAPDGRPGEPSASPAAVAADGTDVEACRDGDCEILVTGPLTVPLDGTYVTEISLELDGDTVDFTMEPAPGTSIGGGIGVGCVAGLTIGEHGGGSRSACGDNATSVAPPQGMLLRATQGGDGVIVEITTLR